MISITSFFATTLAQTTTAHAEHAAGIDPVTMVLVLMLSVAVLALLASKIGVPYPAMMVVGGLVICFLPRFHIFPKIDAFSVDPHLIFTLFLPPLLYGAAWQMSWKDFWANRRPIFLLAVGLVIFTTVGIAIIAKAIIPDLSWAAAFALGAILSPPDAIAVTALAKKL
jgi:monovalent cation/hydrogen antiporter